MVVSPDKVSRPRAQEVEPLGRLSRRRVREVRSVGGEKQHKWLLLLSSAAQKFQRIVAQNVGEVAGMDAPCAMDVQPLIKKVSGPAGTRYPEIELRPGGAQASDPTTNPNCLNIATVASIISIVSVPGVASGPLI